MATHLNITNDPKLEDARRQLELTMLGIDMEMIKEGLHLFVINKNN